MDHNGLGDENIRDRSELLALPEALRVKVGKYADSATPMRALADATVLSAAAISGLRSMISDGKLTGMDGTVAGNVSTGTEKREAGLPISRAIACSNWERCTPISIAWASVASSW